MKVLSPNFGLNLRVSALAGCFASCLSSVCLGYEFSTHAALTREAYVRWMAHPANLTILDRLGLTARQDSLGLVYIDLGPGSQDVNERLASPRDDPKFGRDHIDAANRFSAYSPDLASIAGWVMLGSIREDDVPLDPGASENTPQDDLQGPFIRVRNHFYDPFWTGHLHSESVRDRRRPFGQ